MTSKRVRAGSVSAARRKAGGPRTVVTKVNKIAGSRKGNKSTYQVITKNKK